ncbi:MAG: hypothetical protein IPP17_03435 [Bacteroidetes bacterium]|nr:hypothetical protein [Bacteroidota bacterium]
MIEAIGGLGLDGRFKQLMEQQHGTPRGGNKWIGTDASLLARWLQSEGFPDRARRPPPSRRHQGLGLNGNVPRPEATMSRLQPVLSKWP